MVTTAVPVLIFPFTSVTVKVTVLFPIFEQVNELGETVVVAIPQASVDPLLTWEPVIVAAPKLFNWTVMFWVVTTGLTVSNTVTTADLVTKFPLTSVTVNTTLLFPTFEHVNVLGETVLVAIPQISDELAVTWVPVIDTAPKLLK